MFNKHKHTNSLLKFYHRLQFILPRNQRILINNSVTRKEKQGRRPGQSRRGCHRTEPSCEPTVEHLVDTQESVVRRPSELKQGKQRKETGSEVELEQQQVEEDDLPVVVAVAGVDDEHQVLMAMGMELQVSMSLRKKSSGRSVVAWWRAATPAWPRRRPKVEKQGGLGTECQASRLGMQLMLFGGHDLILMFCILPHSFLSSFSSSSPIYASSPLVHLSWITRWSFTSTTCRNGPKEVGF